jgi:uncharacterized protein (DUF1800 family)
MTRRRRSWIGLPPVFSQAVVSAVRAVDADVRDASSLLVALQQLDMPLYESQPPTGYPDRAEAWVNPGALLARMDFAVALAAGQIDGVTAVGNEQVALSLGAPDFQRR